jgi:hypothetical protein
LERCVPRPSLRRKRKRITIAAMAFIVGVLAVVMGGKEGRHFMTPGKLSSHHAGLTNCSTCHAGARSGHVDLLHRLVTAVEPRQNSNLCVTCHVMGGEPFAPHTHPVEDLKRLTETLRSASRDWPPESLMQRIAFSTVTRSRAEDAEIQCATCHQEHQGVFGNLKAVSNQRCQTCHVARFGSFAVSHPQFVKFPYRRRPRIIFDHRSHMTKHFREAEQVAPDSCGDCHQPGVRRRYMVVKSFGTMCSGCHTGDITGATQVSGPKGIDVIAVPGLDLATLSERGVDIGGWPKDSEAVLTPFMRLLLESNGESVVSDVAGLDLLDLRRASDKDLARVAALAWAVKRLFNLLEAHNPSAAGVLVGDKSDNQGGRPQMASLTGGMSHDVIAAGNREWFPDLQDDLQRYDRGEPTRNFKLPAKPTTEGAKPAPASTGSKIIEAPKAPGAASSDDILAPEKGASGSNLSADSAAETLAPSKKDDILAPSKKDDILAAKDKDDILSGDKPAAGNALSAVGDDGVALQGGDKKASSGAKKSAGATSAQFDPEVWAQTGGWYREDYNIRYRPTGHADGFLQTWLDFAGWASGTGLHDQLTPVFDKLASKDAVGRCTKCHSVDDAAGAKIVNWQPFDPNVINNRFTNYSHKPHIELTDTKTCIKCHELQQTDGGFLKTYEGGNPAKYTPNFKYLDKAVCAACHSQQTAWENCTLCHGYHVPDVESTSPARALPVAFDKLATSPAGTAVLPLDPEADARRDYAMAEQAATEQAWDDFIASHPSGHYHDLAVEQLAKFAPAAPSKSVTEIPNTSAPPTSDKLTTVVPDRPAATPDNSPQMAPDKSAAAIPGKATPPAPEKSATGLPESSSLAAPGKLATATPEDSASAASAKPAGADAGEPTDIDGIFRRGLQLATQGVFALALRDFDEVIRRDPSHAGALNNRCWVLAMLDELQDALKDCDASLRAVPNFPDAFDSRGLVNLKLGLYKKAIADYTAALSRLSGPQRASSLYGRGIARRRSGNAAGAKSDIDAAKIIKPNIGGEFASYGIQ